LFSAIKYKSGCLELIDQRLLPLEKKWVTCSDLESVAIAIEDMVVRGAPAIACVAAYGLAMDAFLSNTTNWEDYRSDFIKNCERLKKTRPTAVNLFNLISDAKNFLDSFEDKIPMSKVKTDLEKWADGFFDNDLETCRAIGEVGLSIAGEKKISILTHCNAGSLATAGYGTALGVIRSLHAVGQLNYVFVDETRPYMQGTRLTAFELIEEGIPFSLQVDSAAASTLASGHVDWVVVGADRIASNGDTANKIGTYALAILAKYHGVAFYVAAPVSTFDFNARTGEDIPIEQRPAEELTSFGGHPIAAPGTEVINPSFDVTPAELITGIITEEGVIRAPYPDHIATLME